jgi:hypothetical protein
MEGSQRRKFLRKSFAIRGCGENVIALRCADCGITAKETARILMSCGLRVCPCCARARANRLRHELLYAAERTQRPGFEHWMFTFTLKFDPCSTEQHSVDGLRDRLDRVALGVRYVWRRLLKAPGRAFVVCFEVAPGGAVHAHALYYGPRADVDVVRTTWLMQCPDSPQVNVKARGSASDAVLEVVKYIAKAASPKHQRGETTFGRYVDPALAARMEIAFQNRRMSEVYGAWRGMRPKRSKQPDHDPATCPVCEGTTMRESLMSKKQWARVAPADWIPRFTKFHARPKVRRSNNVEQEGEANGDDANRAGSGAETRAHGDGGRPHPGRESQDGAGNDRKTTAPAHSRGPEYPNPDPCSTLVDPARPRRAATEQ